MIVSYYISAFTTYHPQIPRLDFDGENLVCQMFCSSRNGAILLVTDRQNPFAGVFQSLDRLVPLRQPLPVHLKEVFYAISVASEGNVRSTGFRHQFHGKVLLQNNMTIRTTGGFPLFRREPLSTISDDLQPIEVGPTQWMTQFVA